MTARARKSLARLVSAYLLLVASLEKDIRW